ncbi:dihydroxyacetone kinase family protein [Curtobacterium ammoniigenes]|uniref:dihydroxyacetone kinase family protein n=1 Tax=Curtobacterium ammoniigenes TaxID=395387 RepID=UPI000833161E|nr:dihydroxyacetone kinase family protein [Curtobacterium ammoniigenes]
MTHLFDDPTTFSDDALAGFVAANQRFVRGTEGGVLRAAGTEHGHVAVVIGGGSGHYPAFAGLVGPGLAAAAVCGPIFTSPSAAHAQRVARAAQNGGGVLFSYGNYAGDVLHFGQAEERLNAAGIPTRTVLVTDDIASAPVEEREKRRGIAGDLTVFKVAGAAADRGDTLDEVVRVAEHANDRTRSLGVAFAGCTLPGSDEPLFTVPDGMMSLGLGIHGEPGISDHPMPSARELAELLVSRLLDERPEGADTRVVPILNGLGTITNEELFVLYGHVASLLAEAGLHIVEPECGQLVTSLDMSGLSLTLLWLDDELADLWAAPCQTPAYRKGSLPEAVFEKRAAGESADAEDATAGLPIEPAQNAAAAAVGARVVDLLVAIAATLADQEHELGALDAIAGDGDHGAGMLRGARAAQAAGKDAAAAGAGVDTVLQAAGDAWSEEAGGTSGALWGAGISAAGRALGDKESYDGSDAVRAVAAFRDDILHLGKAEIGDKTLVDALIPYADALATAMEGDSSTERLLDATQAAADRAETAAQATSDLRPKKGRARPLAERSVGHPDPGAISFALIAATIARQIRTERTGDNS